ncbi:MAG: hypothetical protein IKP82_06765 [Oscillospiraceae bacterium]|nr:hypothetical protein [Oscillospiraceae bacterium]
MKTRRFLIALIGFLVFALQTSIGAFAQIEETIPTAKWLCFDYEEIYMAMAPYKFDLKIAEVNLENALKDRSVRVYNSETGQWEWVPDPRLVANAQKKYDEALNAFNQIYSRILELYGNVDLDILSVATSEYGLNYYYKEYLSVKDDPPVRIYTGDEWIWQNTKAVLATQNYNLMRAEFSNALLTLGYDDSLGYQIMSVSLDNKEGNSLNNNISVSFDFIRYNSNIDTFILVGCYSEDGKMLWIGIDKGHIEKWEKEELQFDVPNLTNDAYDIRIFVITRQSLNPIIDINYIVL